MTHQNRCKKVLTLFVLTFVLQPLACLPEKAMELARSLQQGESLLPIPGPEPNQRWDIEPVAAPPSLSP